MNFIRTTALAAAACAAPLAITGTAQAATLPAGALVSARAALSNWDCAPIMDQKFFCQDAAGVANFSVVERAPSSLPKWQDDPELTPQIAVIRKSYFLTVQPNNRLSQRDFDKVKQAVAHR